ncbi:MAG: hypothetical protein E2P02_07610 [Acidobacteria bacterium]|nr:MAG: hypothetical protein E2P02_07610 [Acidobacteriota bacterium]
MIKVDQFESVFKSAAKLSFKRQELSFQKIAVVTDLEEAEAKTLAARVRAFLQVLGDGPEWIVLDRAQSETVEQLLGLVAQEKPELLVTYRNLHSAAWRWPHSLGPRLDVLTQATSCPVMVLPHPRDVSAFDASMQHTEVVMAVTDHLVGDSRLVSYAASFTEKGGDLFLAHIEDDAIFERYIEVISKIPSIDTDNAREQILKQLLKEPRDYIESCRRELKEEGSDLRVHSEVRTGHHLTEYKKLVEDHSVQLLVLNTKDEDQLAMHGLAFPLAVELRQIPLLMV